MAEEYKKPDALTLVGIRPAPIGVNVEKIKKDEIASPGPNKRTIDRAITKPIETHKKNKVVETIKEALQVITDVTEKVIKDVKEHQSPVKIMVDIAETVMEDVENYEKQE